MSANHSPVGNESHTSRRTEDHTLGNCDSPMISEELISKDGCSDEANKSSKELLSSVINDKRCLSTSEKREVSLLTADKQHETPTTITTTAPSCAADATTAATATTTTTTPRTTMAVLVTSDTSTRTQETTVSPMTTILSPDCMDRHEGARPVLQMQEKESVGEGQTQEREDSPSQLFPDAVDLDVSQCSPDVVSLDVQEPQFLPEKVVLLLDRQDAYLRPFALSNVQQIYDPKLNFGNAFDLIKTNQHAFKENTLFVMLCGTMSALRQVINEKCLLFQCKEPLYNYTLQELKNPSLDEFLISEAKILRKNIKEMNNCDVIFTGVLPIRISFAEKHEAAKHYTRTGHQVKLACSKYETLYAQLCSALRKFNRWAKTDAASKGFPQWSLVDMFTTNDAADSSHQFTHPTQADGVTLTGECMVRRRLAIRTGLRETFIRPRKTSQSLKLPHVTANKEDATANKEEVEVVAVVPRQCSYKPEVFKQPKKMELDEVVLLANQFYRANLVKLPMKQMCLLTEQHLYPERIAKIVEKYYSKVPKGKKTTWILCLGIHDFVQREHYHACSAKMCDKKLKVIVDENTKGPLHQKIQRALSTIQHFQSALEKALPNTATVVVAPPLPSIFLNADTFTTHTHLHIIAKRHHMFLCSSLTYCFIRRFYVHMYDLWVDTVMKQEGGTCAELMSSYITAYKDKSLGLADTNHSDVNITIRQHGKEWNAMMVDVISATLTPTCIVSGLTGLQRSVYLSRLTNVISYESSQSRGQTLTYTLPDKPAKTDYSFKQVVVVGNQMPAELDELCHRLSIHVVPQRVTFDEAGKALLAKYEKFRPRNTLWVILTDVLHLSTAKPLPACEASKCRNPIPLFSPEKVPHVTEKIDILISKVKRFFDSLIDKLGEESAVFLPPVTPVFLMRADLQESHQALHAMYDNFGKTAMVNGKAGQWKKSYSRLKVAWLKMLEPYLEHYPVPKRILQLYSTPGPNRDWIKTLGNLLVHFATTTTTTTTTNIDESEAVFSDAELSSGEEDMMEDTAMAAAAAASVPTCGLQTMSTRPAQTQATAGQRMQHELERTPRQQQQQQQQNKGAAIWSAAQKQSHVVKEKEKRDYTTPMIEARQEKKSELSSGEEDMMVDTAMATTAAAASVPTCSLQTMSTRPAQTQATAEQRMQHEPERTPRQQQQQQQNKGAAIRSAAQKQSHVVKEKEQQPHKEKRDYTTPMIEVRQEKKSGKDNGSQTNKKCHKTSRKGKDQVPPRTEKRQWHGETDRSLQPPKKKLCQETAKAEEGQLPPRLERGYELCGKKTGKANAKQDKVQETSKEGKNKKASRRRKRVRPSRQKESQETSQQRICQVTSEPGRNKKEEGQKTSVHGKCHVLTKTERDEETLMYEKDQESSKGGNDHITVKMKKVHESPIPRKDQVTIKMERCPEFQGLEESEQLQVTVKMEADQSIVKTEQLQDIIKSEEFEDTGRSEEVEGGGIDRQLSDLEKDAWIILSQTDEDKCTEFPERDHMSNHLEDITASSGTLTHIPKTECPLTKPDNSSTAFTGVPKSESESGHCENDALAKDGLWEDMAASVIMQNVEGSYCRQDVDDSSPKDDSEKGGSKQNTEQRIPRKNLDRGEPKENLEGNELKETGNGLKQNTEQHDPNHDVMESHSKEATENNDLKPATEQSIPKQEIKQTFPKQTTKETHPEEHHEEQTHKTDKNENVPSQGDSPPDFEVASNPDSIETVPLDIDSVEQEYIFNLSDDSDMSECEPEHGAGGEDLDIQIIEEVVVSAPLEGIKTEGDAEDITCLSSRKRKLSSSGQDSPAHSYSSYSSGFDSSQGMKELFSLLEESLNQTYQLNLQTFMQVPEVHPDYEAKHAEFLKSYRKHHEGKEHNEEDYEKSWMEFWEDTVGKQLHEDWEKNKKKLVDQFRIIESSNSSREGQPKQGKTDESDEENQLLQSYSSNPLPLLSICQKQSELSPHSESRPLKSNSKYSSDFESCKTGIMQCKQLLSKMNIGMANCELKWQTHLDMNKVMTNDTTKRVKLILSSFALLSELGRSLGSLAPVVVPIIKAVLDKEVDSEEALKILAKKDNVEVLKKCSEKLMLLGEKAKGAYKNKLLMCAKDTIELLENVSTSLKTIKVMWDLDVPSIAKATARQDTTHILQFIKDTLASKGVHDPSKSMLNELFLAVSSEHFNLAIQSQPTASPDPSK